MKYIFIVNPVAGRISLAKKTAIINEVCQEKGIDYKIIETKNIGHATKIASLYRDVPDHIIFSVGGDGTMNEVLNGLVGTENMLGVIGFGSGNDFIKTLRTIPEKEVMSDVGVINGRYFLNVLCMGIDSYIGYNAEKMKKPFIPRKQIYDASMIYSFFSYKPHKLECTYNGNIYNNGYMLFAICNGKYYGSGYHISPNSRIDSGEFDLYYIDEVNKLLLLGLIPKIKKGLHIDEKYKKYIKSVPVKELHLRSEYDLICNVDGELLIGKEFDISIIEKGIRIFNDHEFIDSFSLSKRR